MKILSFEQELDVVLNDLKSLLLEKNAKYGDSALNPKRIFSKSGAEEQILVRIDDKLSRIQNGAEDENNVQDLMGYLVLLSIVRNRE
jgi:hypothetical protein